MTSYPFSRDKLTGDCRGGDRRPLPDFSSPTTSASVEGTPHKRRRSAKGRPQWSVDEVRYVSTAPSAPHYGNSGICLCCSPPFEQDARAAAVATTKPFEVVLPGLQDDRLRCAVAHYNGRNWKRIAEHFANRSDVQCFHRWQSAPISFSAAAALPSRAHACALVHARTRKPQCVRKLRTIIQAEYSREGAREPNAHPFARLGCHHTHSSALWYCPEFSGYSPGPRLARYSGYSSGQSRYSLANYRYSPD